jgi:hypothetical protein
LKGSTEKKADRRRKAQGEEESTRGKENQENEKCKEEENMIVRRRPGVDLHEVGVHVVVQ